MAVMISDLSDDILLVILDHLHDISPSTVKRLASISRWFHDKARYVQHHNLQLNVGINCKRELKYLQYLSSSGFLAAVRTLIIAVANDAGEKLRVKYTEALDNVIKPMGGLRDVHWKVSHRSFKDMDPYMLINLVTTHHPRARFHTHLGIDCSEFWRDMEFCTRNHPTLRTIRPLCGSQNMYSLRINLGHAATQASLLETAQSLKDLLISYPGLRKLTLGFNCPFPCPEYGSRGCLVVPEKYMPLLFGDDQSRAAVLEDLEVLMHMHKPNVSNLATWAENLKFDWSRLRKVHLPPLLEFRAMAEKLIALEDLSLTMPMNSTSNASGAMFLDAIPTTVTLKAISLFPLRPCRPSSGTGQHSEN